ncbi:TetR/AcrR family transcriptional regulator [Naumannella halotolerans]|uniref:AcrR family transcriptional regulator n=1 Tax=Naumannella halotolerans TaxID=993414 RepID=A0A4R7J3Q6_9ACTN|nr:TetR/AcrR family transcriptional regulator [Naumannella halotolerans]TDT31156.1 AcrR family transcriptional regulator [Naumannella halotolerans]
MTQISERRAQTREKLADAATEVFAERGILAATVEEICESAGFTRGAFYSNFGSKDDLVIALVERWKRVNLDHTIEILGLLAETDAEVSFDRLTDGVADLMLRLQPPTRTDALLQAEIELYAARSPRFAQQHRVLLDGLLRSVAELMRKAVLSVDFVWVIEETEAAELFFMLHTYIASELLLTGSFDRAKLVRILKPLLQSLLLPRHPQED